jgi:hypothetical protein
LRVLVPITNAIVGIDVADRKQMVVVTDHDSKVLARKTFRCRAWDLGTALDWAGKQASSKGFANVTGGVRADRQLRCHVPEPVDQTWGRLRHLGARREQLLVEAGSQVQQIRALLECVWPAALDVARQPSRSSTWPATLSVVIDALGRPTGATRPTPAHSRVSQCISARASRPRMSRRRPRVRR